MIPGRIIDDKYRIVRVIGRGGMSVVAEADHLLLGQRVAIKFLRTDVARALAAEPRFFREARLAARLMSRHTCRVSDVGVWESGPYLVLELLEGRTLNQELRVRKTISVADACEIILQACDALAEAHSLGIVHRDIKPGNFFLCNDEANRICVKVLDFGVAKIPAAVVTRNGEGSLTDGNTLIGTPSYISPEQLQNSKIVDARSDIWGLGVVLYEMLSGHPPFQDAWVPRMLVKIAREPHVPLRIICPDIPEILGQVIERCLSKNPSERYKSAADLGLVLADIAPPSDEIIERLMAFGTSVPRLATFSSSPPSPEQIADIEAMDFGHNNSLDPYTTALKHVRRSRRMPSALVAASSGVLFGAIAAAVLLGRGTRIQEERSAHIDKENGAFVASASPKPPASAPQDQAQVELFATPAQTQWLLDGVLLGTTPHIGEQPRDHRIHTLTAQAPGYEPRSLTVYLDRDLSLSLALERKICPTSTPAPAGAPSPKNSREPRGRSLDNLNPYSNSGN